MMARHSSVLSLMVPKHDSLGWSQRESGLNCYAAELQINVQNVFCRNLFHICDLRVKHKKWNCPPSKLPDTSWNFLKCPSFKILDTSWHFLKTFWNWNLKFETLKDETWTPILETEHIHLPLESFKIFSYIILNTSVCGNTLGVFAGNIEGTVHRSIDL